MVQPTVLDTTVASLLFDKRPELALYKPHLTGAYLTICFQTVAEMRYGALHAGWGTGRRQALEAFFTSLDVVAYDDALAWHWAEVMRDAHRAGRRLEAGDAWIAATAKLLNAPLLTHDKDFSPAACPLITVYRYGPS